MADEFYIGYEAGVPPATAARVRHVVPTLIVALLVAASLGLWLHARLGPSRFDFGRPHAAEGVLTRRPYPALDVGGRTVWLVGQGKHGAEATLGAAPDGPVRLEGATIARGPHEMLEVVPGSVHALAEGAPPTPAPHHVTMAGDEVTLTGQIVDSKCFLGVMNPGEGTVHRDCAGLCLRGGIPPMLLVRDERGDESLVLLVGDDGRAIGPELAQMAGLAVRVRGRLTRDDTLPRLATDPAAITRLAPE
jgi:hypothetical protein